MKSKGPTGVPACEILSNRPNNLVSHDVSDDPQVFCRERMLVHERVHRREYVRGCRRCQSTEQRGLRRVVTEQNLVSPSIHTARLSQSPCAIFESVFAEQGATSTISAHLLNSMCRIGSPILYEPWYSR